MSSHERVRDVAEMMRENKRGLLGQSSVKKYI
jgi:hypothetical protein